MNVFCEILLLSVSAVVIASAEYCDNETGECKNFTDTDCPEIFFNQHLIGSGLKYCDEFNDIICCPIPLNLQNRHQVDTSRKFERACREYSEFFKCHTTPYIFGGTKATPKQFPFMALVGLRHEKHGPFKWGHCAGTLIHPKFVLTAAHCLETSYPKSQILDPNHNSSKFVVRLGELDYSSSTDDASPTDFEVVNYVVHPFYNDDISLSRHNDIAIIELDRNATFSAYIAPACLPSDNGERLRHLTAAGWGLTENGQLSSHLLSVQLGRVPDEDCVERIENKILPRTQFCARAIAGNGDTCDGDSGGPIFAQHPRYNCIKQLIGITSYGLVCGHRVLPSVYTKLHLYTDWIEQIVWPD